MKIYIGNLSKQLTDAQLKDLVCPFGEPKSLSVATELSGKSMGFGFVEFGSDHEARAAITGLNGKEVHGQVLEVNAALQGSEDGDDH